MNKKKTYPCCLGICALLTLACSPNEGIETGNGQLPLGEFTLLWEDRVGTSGDMISLPDDKLLIIRDATIHLSEFRWRLPMGETCEVVPEKYQCLDSTSMGVRASDLSFVWPASRLAQGTVRYTPTDIKVRRYQALELQFATGIVPVVIEGRVVDGETRTDVLIEAQLDGAMSFVNTGDTKLGAKQAAVLRAPVLAWLADPAIVSCFLGSEDNASPVLVNTSTCPELETKFEEHVRNAGILSNSSLMDQ